MSEGFSVDLGALRGAATGIEDTIDPDRSIVGHEALGGTIGDFCERWDIGVSRLDDAQRAEVRREPGEASRLLDHSKGYLP